MSDVARILSALSQGDPHAASQLLLGGAEIMIESPMIQELIAERTRQTLHWTILKLLENRFGPVPAEVSAAVRVVQDQTALETLFDHAASCPDLDSFRARTSVASPLG
jgi:hypothetical protein